ncbi:uncharacterized protein V3H82_022803 [Fundulus diaphanus]
MNLNTTQSLHTGLEVIELFNQLWSQKESALIWADTLQVPHHGQPSARFRHGGRRRRGNPASFLADALHVSREGQLPSPHPLLPIHRCSPTLTLAPRRPTVPSPPSALQPLYCQSPEEEFDDLPPLIPPDRGAASHATAKVSVGVVRTGESDPRVPAAHATAQACVGVRAPAQLAVTKIPAPSAFVEVTAAHATAQVCVGVHVPPTAESKDPPATENKDPPVAESKDPPVVTEVSAAHPTAQVCMDVHVPLTFTVAAVATAAPAASPSAAASASPYGSFQPRHWACQRKSLPEASVGSSQPLPEASVSSTPPLPEAPILSSLPPSKSHEEVQEDLPPSKSHEEVQEDLPPSKSHEEVQEDLPPSKSHEGVQEDPPPSKSHEGVQEDPPPSKSHEGVQEDPPPSKSHEGVQEDPPPPKPHEGQEKLPHPPVYHPSVAQTTRDFPTFGKVSTAPSLAIGDVSTSGRQSSLCQPATFQPQPPVLERLELNVLLVSLSNLDCLPVFLTQPAYSDCTWTKNFGLSQHGLRRFLEPGLSPAEPSRGQELPDAECELH